LTGLRMSASIRHVMTAARELESSGPGMADRTGPERTRVPERPSVLGSDLSPGAGNRALARALSDAATSRTLALADAAATRTLARCPGCGGRCGGTCGHGSEPDEELLASGQRALRRAVRARREAVSPRS
jgi:hypothetical protein